jgi:glycosyltransferase involved in cell wall biosynthesis
LTDLGWPEDAFVVGGCGTPGWRKGTDLFLQIARLIVRDDAKRRACFLWVGGGEATDADVLQFTHEIQTLGLAQWCRRIPSTADVHDYYSAMDIFALTSREDPFPLVMLEAGMQGLPTVCFSSAGGAPEFVADDAGLIVPYLDLEAFAHSVEALRESSELRRHLGERARDKVKTYYGVKTQGPKLLQSIERCLATGCT